MRDVPDDVVPAWEEGGVTGLATVVNTIRSAPRLPGAAMVVPSARHAIHADGREEPVSRD